MILPRDFLDHAKKLTDPKNIPTEADCRSAVSRAYYSLYHETVDVLTKKNYSIPTKETHKFVSKTLSNLNRNIGRKYRGFRDDRNQADYQLALSFSQKYSQIKVSQIEKLIQLVKSRI